ncbi:hypothetical protein MKW92_002826 [Papaver armeniacum]|nr:hypothetical protein MKW92_002826 [Papaver armeniacum]
MSGAISGGISRTITSPLDVIKIRFQYTGIKKMGPPGALGNCLCFLMTWYGPVLHKEMFGSSKYTRMMEATKDFLREEGLTGFWHGNVPTLLMVMDHTHLSPCLSYLSGSLAGCVATVGSYPFDLLRTILASAFVDILRNRGFRGLYAGLAPTLTIPYAGLQFGTYDTFKGWMLRLNRHISSNQGSKLTNESLSSFQLFVCGLASGTCAKAVCHPLDVVKIKKRFQITGLPRDPKYGGRIEHHIYNGMFDALRRIPVTEGWAGLYKGIVPSVIKAVPAGALTFVAYEYTSAWLQSHLT